MNNRRPSYDPGGRNVAGPDHGWSGIRLEAVHQREDITEK